MHVHLLLTAARSVSTASAEYLQHDGTLRSVQVEPHLLDQLQIGNHSKHASSALLHYAPPLSKEDAYDGCTTSITSIRSNIPHRSHNQSSSSPHRPTSTVYDKYDGLTAPFAVS